MKWTKKSAQEKIVDSPKNVLYVVLHGLVCLIDDNRDTFIADRSTCATIMSTFAAAFLFDIRFKAARP
jgi:hypothetical protein